LDTSPGYDPNGIPEFVRARKAAQYSNSIDDFARIMKDGNNGGYANNWLLADIKNNEIASLELGLKNVTLEKKKDGYFVGSNFPVNEKLIREETDFDPKGHECERQCSARALGTADGREQGQNRCVRRERFMADHYDTSKKEEADERTLDGHIDLSPRGSQPWQPPYGNAGAVQNKAADATMVSRMSFAARPAMPAAWTSKGRAASKSIPSSAGSKACCTIWTRFRGRRSPRKNRRTRARAERRFGWRRMPFRFPVSRLAHGLIPKLAEPNKQQQDIEQT
jgi:hypothetical protein